MDHKVSDGSVFLFINMTRERFSRCFSKFEVVAALEFIRKASEDLGITVMGISADTRIQAQLDDSYSSDHKTRYDQGFLEKFLKLSIHDSVANIDFPDAFLSEDFMDLIAKRNIETVYLCGFDAEHEILASAIGAIREGLRTVVVSDAISSRNERVYFECLDILMKWCTVKDTRDLMKEWNIW